MEKTRPYQAPERIHHRSPLHGRHQHANTRASPPCRAGLDRVGGGHRRRSVRAATLGVLTRTPACYSGTQPEMAQTRSLPRICIALGLPDVPSLLDHARREAEAGEAFLEFRLDFLNSPCKGAEVIARFLEQFPECTILATCRRHQNHGK